MKTGAPSSFPHMIIGLIAFLAMTALVASVWQARADEGEGVSLFEYFSAKDSLTLELTTHLPNLMLDRGQKEYQNAGIRLLDGHQRVVLNTRVEVRTRGNNRLQACAFPPLKLKWDQPTLRELGFSSSFHKLKLVTHCNGDEALVLKEYLAYKAYAALTEYSYRCHLLKVTYRDAEGRIPPQTYWGILLEDTDELARRVGADKLKGEDWQAHQLDVEQYGLLSAFQYLIGNTDWNIARQHNIKLLERQSDGRQVPVPYDFDHSGLVSAPYARPWTGLPNDSVQERFLQWQPGRSEAALRIGLEKILDQKQALRSLITDFPHLNPTDRQKALAYLDECFDLAQKTLQSDERVVKRLNAHLDKIS